jgi:hypothetical protein
VVTISYASKLRSLCFIDDISNPGKVHAKAVGQLNHDFSSSKSNQLSQLVSVSWL